MPVPSFEAEPDLVLGEEALGPQRLSVRPSSAKYSFGRCARRASLVGSQATPGPAAYDAQASKESVPAAFFGYAAQHEFARPYPYPDLQEKAANLDFVQPASQCAVFGREARDNEVVDLDIVRSNPESRYGRESPGLLYTPDHTKVSRPGGRPTSAPAYTIPGRSSKARLREPSRTPETVAPNSYQAAECTLGAQLLADSRKRSSRSCAFGRASRFPATREASGQLASECTRSASTLGSADCGRHRQRRAPAACFGSAPREGSARARLCRGPADRPPRARMLRPNLPHPPLALLKEQIKYCPVVR